MRKKFWILMGACGFLACCDKAATPKPTAAWVSADGGLQLRAAPNRAAPSIGLLREGSEVTVFSNTRERFVLDGKNAPWSYVSSPLGSGWVFGAFLSSNKVLGGFKKYLSLGMYRAAPGSRVRMDSPEGHSPAIFIFAADSLSCAVHGPEGSKVTLMLVSMTEDVTGPVATCKGSFMANGAEREKVFDACFGFQAEGDRVSLYARSGLIFLNEQESLELIREK